MSADAILFFIGKVFTAQGFYLDEREANFMRRGVILGFFGVNLLNLKMCGGGWNVGGACSDAHGGRSDAAGGCSDTDGGRSDGSGGCSDGQVDSSDADGGRSDGKVDRFNRGVGGRNLRRFSWNTGLFSSDMSVFS